MATTSNESLSELERQAETTRAELAQTVDELHARVSPDALKADALGYVRENPLQAAAIAVGVAYPVYRIIASIPAPVMLIGAGLALAHRSTSGAGYSSSGSANGGGMMASLKDKVSAIGEKVADMGAQVTGKAQDTMGNMRDMASDKMARASEKLSDTYEASRETASGTISQVSDQVTETYARTRETLAEVIERHPFMVGGVAFAVGSLMAAAVPVTRQEKRMLGETSEEFRRRTGDMAQRGLREAQNAARQVYENAAQEVRNQGLTPDAARSAARAAVETARGAVEHATAGATSSSNSN